MHKHEMKIAIAVLVLFCIVMGVLKWVDYSNEQKSIRKWEENLANQLSTNPSTAQVKPDWVIQAESEYKAQLKGKE